MNNQIKATITENGNGLPGIGDMVYDPMTDTAFKVITWDGSDRISTHGPGQGNSVSVIVEEIGGACDLTDDEWESLQSNNYGVDLEEAE